MGDQKDRSPEICAACDKRHGQEPVAASDAAALYRRHTTVEFAKAYLLDMCFDAIRQQGRFSTTITVPFRSHLAVVTAGRVTMLPTEIEVVAYVIKQLQAYGYELESEDYEAGVMKFSFALDPESSFATPQTPLPSVATPRPSFASRVMTTRDSGTFHHPLLASINTTEHAAVAVVDASAADTSAASLGTTRVMSTSAHRKGSTIPMMTVYSDGTRVVPSSSQSIKTAAAAVNSVRRKPQISLDSVWDRPPSAPSDTKSIQPDAKFRNVNVTVEDVSDQDESQTLSPGTPPATSPCVTSNATSPLSPPFAAPSSTPEKSEESLGAPAASTKRRRAVAGNDVERKQKLQRTSTNKVVLDSTAPVATSTSCPPVGAAACIDGSLPDSAPSIPFSTVPSDETAPVTIVAPGTLTNVPASSLAIEDEPVFVSVLHIGMPRLRLVAAMSDSVFALKCAIEKNNQMPVNLQVLTLGGNPLVDGCKLSQYDIVSGTTLVLQKRVV